MVLPLPRQGNPEEDNMKITTNNKPRPMVCLADLPAEVQKDFDYVREQGDLLPRFVQYKGWWYDVHDTMRCPGAEAPAEQRHAFKGWDSYISETFFSGVVFRLIGDDVIVGRYFV